MISGMLVVDKPRGLTSHDVVARVRRIAETRRVGHTGTLDPMATGVLVLCLGQATRLVPYVEEMGGSDAKEYDAWIRFGFETTTDDALGEPRDRPASGVSLTVEKVSAALSSFVGEFPQIPPAFSAKKIGGQRAYAMARRGEEVDLQPVTVQVAKAELIELDGDRARARFACSRGTYIRALARDLGRSLGTGAHLMALRRTRSGMASLDQAVTLDDLTLERLRGALIPMMSILEAWPSLTLGEREVADIRLGRAITSLKRCEGAGARVRVCDLQGGLIALARWEGSRIQPFCVF